MANIKSKEKNIRRIEKSTIRNRAIKSTVKTAMRKAKEAAIAGDANLKTLVSAAHKEIATAVSKGVFHKNNGARKSSRLDAFVAKNKKA